MRVAGDPGRAGINDVLDARHCQGGLGNVGGQHNARAVTGGEHGVLLCQRQPGIERQNLHIAQTRIRFNPASQGIGGVTDFTLAGEENQDVPGCFLGEFIHGVTHGVQGIPILLVVAAVALPVTQAIPCRAVGTHA